MDAVSGKNTLSNRSFLISTIRNFNSRWVYKRHLSIKKIKRLNPLPHGYFEFLVSYAYYNRIGEFRGYFETKQRIDEDEFQHITT